jgi:hypothetical protein
MRALTFWQPWAFIVSRGEKLIENRPWEPPVWLLNQDFAIHAGKKWDRDRVGFIADLYDGLMPTKLYCEQAQCGAVTAVAKVVAVVTSTEAAERLAPGHGKWFFGPYGWVLEDVRPITPAIECRGYQKLWNLPPEIEAQVHERLGN